MTILSVPPSGLHVIWLLPIFASVVLLTRVTTGEGSDSFFAKADPRVLPIQHWDEAPSSLADYPRYGNRTVVNPWIYTDRLGLYKILLRATSGDPTLGRANNTANILWGLPLQHGWQFSSGRLLGFPNGTQCHSSTSVKTHNSWNCISPFSWWASMNYYLSVLPFLGAVKAGLFSEWPFEIEFTSSSHHPQDYCTSLEKCTLRFPSLINDWADFFKTLKYKSASPDPYFQTIGNRADSFNLPSAPPPTLSPREQDIIAKLWVAHTNSLEIAQSLFNVSLLPLMPGPEQVFGLSWANLIDYIAAVNFVTDLNTTVLFQKKYLPGRVLHQGDQPPEIPDFSRDINWALYILETALKIDQQSGNALKHAWQALMCSPESKARGRSMASNLLRLWETLWNVVVLLWLYVTSCFWYT